MALQKRSFTIQGHRTSVALEGAFWACFDRAVAQLGVTPTALVTEIDEARTTALASAIRVWLLAQAESSGAQNGSADDRAARGASDQPEG